MNTPAPVDGWGRAAPTPAQLAENARAFDALEDGGRRNGRHDPRRLLDKTDPRYLRRLVRELNGLPDGFYCDAFRFTRARLRAGRLEAREARDTPRGSWSPIGAPFMSLDTLRDAYGRTVHASRVLVHKDAPRP